MKKILERKLLSRSATVGLLTGTLAVASFFGSASSASAARSANGTTGHCSLGTLNGTYLFSDNGFFVQGGKRTPFSDAGHETYDGNGHVQGVFTLSDNGTITRLIHYTGTYTVTPQCTGTETYTTTTGVTSHFDQFIAPDGSHFTYVETDPGFVLASTEVRA